MIDDRLFLYTLTDSFLQTLNSYISLLGPLKRRCLLGLDVQKIYWEKQACEEKREENESKCEKSYTTMQI